MTMEGMKVQCQMKPPPYVSLFSTEVPKAHVLIL